MPQKNKIAKKRLDRFYYLAKERGYRSRAAFKLLQLEKKYSFLGAAKGVLDLCAAPGSWMQVAREYMSKDAPCIGIDRAPIKPLKGCIALQEDITTQKCRSSIKRELKRVGGEKACIDVVLHDGAPNVGTAWIQDAYDQNELTLYALKLAADVLAPGGWFVTKMFRSNDYNSVLWVFGQLFHKVEATKPPASRNESAEIFVVCQGFKNATIDPKFFNPKHVFKLDEETEAANVLQAKKGKKAPAEGYDTSVQLLHNKVRVVDFVNSQAPVKVLSEANALVWDQSEECERWRVHKHTKPEIIHSCADLKLLGKLDFRRLLQWRQKMIESDKKALYEANGGKEEVEVTVLDEMDKEEAELTELERMANQRLKGAKRRAAEARAKFKERLSLKVCFFLLFFSFSFYFLSLEPISPICQSPFFPYLNFEFFFWFFFVFSLTRPISPICRSPSFPYLTFLKNPLFRWSTPATGSTLAKTSSSSRRRASRASRRWRGSSRAPTRTPSSTRRRRRPCARPRCPFLSLFFFESKQGGAFVSVFFLVTQSCHVCPLPSPGQVHRRGRRGPREWRVEWERRRWRRPLHAPARPAARRHVRRVPRAHAPARRPAAGRGGRRAAE